MNNKTLKLLVVAVASSLIVFFIAKNSFRSVDNKTDVEDTRLGTRSNSKNPTSLSVETKSKNTGKKKELETKDTLIEGIKAAHNEGAEVLKMHVLKMIHFRSFSELSRCTDYHAGIKDYMALVQPCCVLHVLCRARAIAERWVVMWPRFVVSRRPVDVALYMVSIKIFSWLSIQLLILDAWCSCGIALQPLIC